MHLQFGHLRRQALDQRHLLVEQGISLGLIRATPRQKRYPAIDSCPAPLHNIGLLAPQCAEPRGGNTLSASPGEKLRVERGVLFRRALIVENDDAKIDA